jgi:4-aminobutyrate aminotransferase-like enzyme
MLCPGRSGDTASSGSPNQDQARFRRRGALVGCSAASSVFRLRPPLTGSNKAG